MAGAREARHPHPTRSHTHALPRACEAALVWSSEYLCEDCAARLPLARHEQSPLFTLAFLSWAAAGSAASPLFPLSGLFIVLNSVAFFLWLPADPVWLLLTGVCQIVCVCAVCAAACPAQPGYTVLNANLTLSALPFLPSVRASCPLPCSFRSCESVPRLWALLDHSLWLSSTRRVCVRVWFALCVRARACMWLCFCV